MSSHLTPHRLRAESSDRLLGLDRTDPRLSWTLLSPRRGVYVPAADGTVREGGLPSEQAEGVTVEETAEDGSGRLRVGPGFYTFTASLAGARE